MREDHVARLKTLKGVVLMWKMAGSLGPSDLPAADVYYQMRHFNDDMTPDKEWELLQLSSQLRHDAAESGHDPCDVIIYDAVVYNNRGRAVLYVPPGAHLDNRPPGGLTN